jgi:hypothetical protein
MPRLCINCLLAETPCDAAHLLIAPARSVLSALRQAGSAARPRQQNATGRLKELCEF